MTIAPPGGLAGAAAEEGLAASAAGESEEAASVVGSPGSAAWEAGETAVVRSEKILAAPAGSSFVEPCGGKPRVPSRKRFISDQARKAPTLILKNIM